MCAGRGVCDRAREKRHWVAGRGDPGVRGWGKGQDALSHILEDQSALPRDWTSELEKPSGGILGNSIRQTRVQKPALLRSSWVITDKLLNLSEPHFLDAKLSS